ncbi:MAG: TrkA family potassium uptake protein [Anaerolineaceae bacterium]|nr:TrkA family potassium uptake protein [Anaerolineaceae bacterium]
MKVIIVGCGRLGSELAQLLFHHGNEVSIIDLEESAFEILKPDFRGHLVTGDALSQDVLKRAGIETAEAVAAVTSNDAINLVIGRVAKEIYNIHNVVARNFEPSVGEVFELFNLETISGTSWGASRLEEMILSEQFKVVYSFGDGAVDYYQVIVPENWIGKKVADLEQTPGQSLLVSITRYGKSFIPSMEDVLKADDHLHFSATHEGIKTLRQRFGITQQEV